MPIGPMAPVNIEVIETAIAVDMPTCIAMGVALVIGVIVGFVLGRK